MSADLVVAFLCGCSIQIISTLQNGIFTVFSLNLQKCFLQILLLLLLLYIRKDMNLILKYEDFSGSGRLMRTTLMPKYAKVPSGYVPTQIIVKDELNPGENTTQVISELTFDNLPDRIFTKAYLEGLN